MPGSCLSSPQKAPAPRKQQAYVPNTVSVEATPATPAAVPAEHLAPSGLATSELSTIAEPSLQSRDLPQPMETDEVKPKAEGLASHAIAVNSSTSGEADAAEPAGPAPIPEDSAVSSLTTADAASPEQPAAHRRTASSASHRRTGSNVPVHARSNSNVPVHGHRRSTSGASHRRAPSGPRLPTGPEPAQVEIEYVPTDQLMPLDQPMQALTALPDLLGSGDWLENSRGLNTSRQLFVHHRDLIRPQLPTLMPALLKLVKNPRSVLCKTAIMTTGDCFTAFGDAVLPHLSQPTPTVGLLMNLLLKASSNDKKFVVEEARSALNKLAYSCSPVALLEVMGPYVPHKSPKVRGHVAITMVEAVQGASDEDINAYGMDRLLQVAGRYINDNTAEAREAARQMVGRVRAAHAAVTGGGAEDWELAVKAALTSAEAMAVLKV